MDPLFKIITQIDLEKLIEEGFFYYVILPAIDLPEWYYVGDVETYIYIPCKKLADAATIVDMFSPMSYVYSIEENLSELFEGASNIGIDILIPVLRHFSTHTSF